MWRGLVALLSGRVSWLGLVKCIAFHARVYTFVRSFSAISCMLIFIGTVLPPCQNMSILSHCEGTSWQTEDGATLAEGNANDGRAKDDGSGGSEGKEPQQSFEWRAGHERMTTGLWMYSEPFFHTAVIPVLASVCF